MGQGSSEETDRVPDAARPAGAAVGGDQAEAAEAVATRAGRGAEEAWAELDRVTAARAADRRATTFSAAIYGVLIATTILLGFGTELPVVAMAISLLVTMALMALSGAYAQYIGRRIEQGSNLSAAETRAILRRQWPQLAGGLPIIIVLVVTGLVGVPGQTGVDAAWVAGVASLFIWGVVWARREGGGWIVCAVTGMGNVCICSVIVFLRLVFNW